MKRTVLTLAIVAIALVAPGVASAKGDLVEIGVWGGGLRHEIRIGATNQDYASEWGAPRRLATEPYYWVRFYVQLPGDRRAYPSNPERYYPARGRLPAVVMMGDGSRAVDWRNWTYVPASLAGRLDDAISAGLGRRVVSADPDRFVTSWPLLGVDVAILLAIVAGVLVLRGWLRRRSLPAPEAPA